MPKCLESVKYFAGQIIVVDSKSADRTVAIAKEYGAEIYEHSFVNQAEQFNWALDNCHINGEWILRLDADEFLTPELAEEIKKTLPDISKNISGFYMKRRVYFMGRWIRYGGYYPSRFLRFFRAGKGRSEEREMDEHIVLLEGEHGHFKNDFVDDNHKGLSDWIQKHNNYSSREAAAGIRELREGVPARSGIWWLYQELPHFVRAFFYFAYRYIFRGGFLDGKEGLVFHFLQGFWYRFLVDAKMLEMRKNSDING